MQRRAQARISAFGLLLGFAAGCGEFEDATSESDVEIKPGATGERVRHIQAYLSRYGYLPNDELSKDPTWHPIVNKSPMPGVFDEVTAQALREFQATSGVPSSGILDSETQALIASPRCGVAEGYDRRRIESKFSLQGGEWKLAITWRVQNTDDVTLDEARAAARRAFATWAADSSLAFTEVTGSADIEIRFGTVDGRRGGAVAVTDNSTHDITIDDLETWAVGATFPADAIDLERLMLHEIGHSINLGHSSISAAIMRSPTVFGPRSRTLTRDDQVAISALYDTWALSGSGARQVAVAQTTSANPAVWMVGNGAEPEGNHKIWKWNYGLLQWDSLPGGAVRIAVEPNGVPWVIASNAEIYRLTSADPATGTWVRMPGWATDIAVGASGAIWVLGVLWDAGGYDIYSWNPNIPTWDRECCGRGVRISVGRTPWIVNAAGEIYRRSGNDVANGTWEKLPGTATEISVLSSGDSTGIDRDYAWHIGSGGTIYGWNEQAADTSTPSRFQWVNWGATAYSLSVDLRGNVWRAYTSGGSEFIARPNR